MVIFDCLFGNGGLQPEFVLHGAEKVEGLEGGDVVEIHPGELVAKGFESGLVQLEEGELEAAVALKSAGLGLDRLLDLTGSCAYNVLGIIHLQSLEGVLGTLDHLFWHPGHPCHMNAEAVCGSTLLELAQENHL